MSDPKLARMANNIAQFFKSYPHDQAVQGVHDHLKAYWTPRMRATLRGDVEAGGAGLDPLVIEAATYDPHARNPTARETAGPAEAGELGAADAG